MTTLGNLTHQCYSSRQSFLILVSGKDRTRIKTLFAIVSKKKTPTKYLTKLRVFIS